MSGFASSLTAALPGPVVSLISRADPPHWYAAYTLPRHEKRAAQQLEIRSIGRFLPLYTVTRSWQHRHATFELPLFPGYIFVHISSKERLGVLTSPGIVQLVGPAGRPTELAENEIEGLRQLVSSHKVCPVPYLQRGDQVRFASGVLAGLMGTVMRTKGSFRVLVSVEAIMRSFSVEIDRNDLELL